MQNTFTDELINLLVIKSSLSNDISLFNGKMGIAIFFAHYAKQTSITIYEDIADELIEEVRDEIHNEIPTCFSSGIAGIAWGLEYLVENKFVSGNSLLVCEEFDKIIMRQDPRRVTDFSLDDGFIGILHYILIHIKNVYTQQKIVPFDNVYLDEIYHLVKILKKTKKYQNQHSLFNNYISFIETGKMPDYHSTLKPFIKKPNLNSITLHQLPLGIQNGLAGYLLNKLFL